MLYRLEPNKQKYTKEKIEHFITQKFIPNENYEEAKLKFNMKVEKSHKSQYTSSFIDFFHSGAVSRFSGKPTLGGKHAFALSRVSQKQVGSALAKRGR